MEQAWPGADGVLGIPASPQDPALRAALSDDELETALAEPTLLEEIGAEARTVADLVTARLGQAVTERLVAPVTTGVYGMRPERMSLAQFAPGLRGPGSLADGATYFELNAEGERRIRFWKSLGFKEHGLDEYDMPLWIKK